jgi:hypothetical protein
MRIERRLRELEKKNTNNKKTLCCIGVEGDPESEKRYEENLRSNIQKPFIWLDV